MRVLKWIVAGLVVVVLLATVAGMLQPRNHVARMTIVLQAPPEQVWALISDVLGAARWRTDLEQVTAVAGSSPERFTEHSGQGEVTFEVVEREAPRRQVTRVVDEGQPFGGTWTWELEPDGSGTRLTITEDGFIRNPIFRLMGKLFFRPTDTMDAYLRALARELNESALPSVP